MSYIHEDGGVFIPRDVEREDRRRSTRKVKPDPDRRKVLDAEMRRLQEERAMLDTLPDGRKMRSGTVLIIHVQYENNTTVYTYTAVKAKGRWYLSGTGRTPQDAGWGAVERWMLDEGRNIIGVYRVTHVSRVDKGSGESNAVTRPWFSVYADDRLGDEV